MGIRDDIAGDWHASLAALAWHVEIGVDEVISEAPVNRYDLPETTRTPAAVATVAAAPRPTPAPAPVQPQVAAVEAARVAAARATSLPERREIIAGFAKSDSVVDTNRSSNTISPLSALLEGVMIAVSSREFTTEISEAFALAAFQR